MLFYRCYFIKYFENIEIFECLSRLSSEYREKSARTESQWVSSLLEIKAFSTLYFLIYLIPISTRHRFEYGFIKGRISDFDHMFINVQSGHFRQRCDLGLGRLWKWWEICPWTRDGPDMVGIKYKSGGVWRELILFFMLKRNCLCLSN